MNIEFVKLTHEYKEQLFEMLTEWKKTEISRSVIGFSYSVEFELFRLVYLENQNLRRTLR